MFAEGDPDVAQRFETHVAKETFGDYALMKGLQAKGVGFERAWPWVQGERVETMEFGLRKGGRRQWCQPVVTLHHVGSEEAQGVWEVERRWVERFPVCLLFFVPRCLMSLLGVVLEASWSAGDCL